MKLPGKSFLETKLLSYSTLGIIVLVILSVWLSGTGSHRSLFQNSIVSTSILAVAFFLFISLGLYFGLKLKDNVGPILNKDNLKKASDKSPMINGFDFEPPAVGDGIGGIIFSIILWFVISILITFLLYFLGISFGLQFYFLRRCYIGFFSELYVWYLKIPSIVKEIY
ncbi:hypothetical protein SAMN05421664_3490 [Chryseobacterium soldanellicola]|uniref:G-protein coupled receptors family 3 profile domain-containing protein n=1 Tax=Chryseobacterium soldanellicola TaxID=311333 RepID=A0A1H1G708_9FLAO|nr:hypothetical protein [Chryseobacterium soldanellicola]SDR08981.1 hypothetical protein SAMN05421664_3490 [Chryseobacterium soldanellicola]